MTAMLFFDQNKLPRTMTRTQWREIDRWRRMTQRQIREAAAAQESLLIELEAFGTAIMEIPGRPSYFKGGS